MDSLLLEPTFETEQLDPGESALESTSDAAHNPPADAEYDPDSDPKSHQDRQPERFLPRAPRTLAEAALSNSLIEQLVLKLLYFKGDLVGGDLCRSMGLSFSLIETIVEGFKTKQLLQVKSSHG